MNAATRIPTTGTSFAEALHADGPDPALAGRLGLYGWLVGAWEMDVVRHLDGGKVFRTDGEIHFGWVLGGRAIQDVWIAPQRPAPAGMFGTTLRVYDPAIDAWHIIWSDPVKQYYSRQIGRAEGDDIVQIGTNAEGEQTRWRFTGITRDSFRWLGERVFAGTDDWRLEVEFFARRVGAVAGSEA